MNATTVGSSPPQTAPGNLCELLCANYQSVFTDKVKSDGRALDPVIWINDESVALHVGAPTEAGPIFIANSNGISEFPGILGFGRSHDRTFIALASAAGIEIRRGWNGEVTATIPWPSLFENIPAPHQKPRAPKPLTIMQLAVFPDGERSQSRQSQTRCHFVRRYRLRIGPRQYRARPVCHRHGLTASPRTLALDILER
jgi:hypothetical protein